MFFPFIRFYSKSFHNYAVEVSCLMKKIIFTVLLLTGYNISRSQVSKVTLSGIVRAAANKVVLPFVNITLKTKDTIFVTGTITNEDGRFTLTDVKTGNYLLECSYVGYQVKLQSVLVGELSNFLDLGVLN